MKDIRGSYKTQIAKAVGSFLMSASLTERDFGDVSDERELSRFAEGENRDFSLKEKGGSHLIEKVAGTFFYGSTRE